jgi:flagellin-like protein
MRKLLRSKKALSPVVAAIILIAVTVAVSIAVAAWMGALTFTFMGSTSITITGVTFNGNTGDQANNITFSWPGQYGICQSTMRSHGMMLGCRDYYDSKVNHKFPVMVTNVGPKPNEYSERPILMLLNLSSSASLSIP